MHGAYKSKIILLFKRIQSGKKSNVVIAACLMIAVFVSYFVYGLQFQGPMYMSDEIGYLTKAIALSGGNIDAATSWQGGYSFFILPAFWLFNDPVMEWRAVLFINAAMWALSAGLLFYALKRFLPKKSDLEVSLAVILSFVYPAFISISGYAFATSGFVFVLMLALAALAKSDFKNTSFLSVFALLVGYLYWIHPIGATVVAAAAILFVVKGIIEKHYVKYALLTIIMIALPLLYFFFVRPWFNDIMTPDGMSIFNHYNDLNTDITSGFERTSFWVEIPIFFIGQVSYVLISTFGLVALCIGWAANSLLKTKKNWLKNIIDNTYMSSITIVLLAMVFSMVIGAVCFASNLDPSRVDQWIYGRYSEMLILPLIAFGFLSEWKSRTVFISAGTVLSSGIILSLYTNSGNTILESIGRVNIQSFWPMLVMKQVNYLIWFIIGCVGIISVGMVGRKKENKNWALLFILPIMVLTINDYSSWHIDRQANSGLAEYYSLGNIISKIYKYKTCVGLDPQADDRNQRYRFYSFYLHRFEVARMEQEDWLKSCDGPYLTYDIGFIKNMSDIKPVAKESRSGLYVLMRRKDIKSVSWPMSNRLVYYGDSRYGGCGIKSCLSWNASSNDTNLTEVGQYVDGTLTTTGQSGYLLYGPGVRLSNGLYHVKVSGSFRKTDFETRLTVTSDGGEKIYLSGGFDPETNNYDYVFKISKEVDDLEVRLYVTSDADVSLYSYDVVRSRY